MPDILSRPSPGAATFAWIVTFALLPVFSVCAPGLGMAFYAGAALLWLWIKQLGRRRATAA